jgi:hypothetical protein
MAQKTLPKYEVIGERRKVAGARPVSLYIPLKPTGQANLLFLKHIEAI